MASEASAGVKVWDGGAATTNWQDAANWSPDGVPTSEDDVTIDVPGSITVTLTSGSASANSLTCLEHLALTGGTLTLASASTCAQLSLTGNNPVLQGSGLVTVSDSFAWSRGTMSGSGKTVVLPTASASLAGVNGQSRTLSRELDLQASATLTTDPSNQVFGLTITPTGTLKVSAGATLTASGTTWLSNGGGGSVVVNGTLAKVGAGDLGIGNNISVTNAGTIDVQSGGIAWVVGGNGVATHTGTVSLAGGTIYRAGGASQSFQAESTVTGSGLLVVDGGTVSADGTLALDAIQVNGGSLTLIGGLTLGSGAVTMTGGTLTSNIALPLASLNLTGNNPVLQGSGLVTVSNSFAWSRGTMSGSGKTVVLPTASASLPGVNGQPRTLSRELDLQASATLTTDPTNPSFGLTITPTGTLKVSAGATLTASGTTWLSNGGGGSVVVNGTLAKVGTGNLSIGANISLTNAGTVDIQSGGLSVQSTLPQLLGTTLTGGSWIARNSSITLAAGQTIRTIAGGASVTLEGPSASFAALAPLTTIAAGGSLSLVDGFDFTASPVGGSFSNAGSLALGVDADLDVAGAYSQSPTGILSATFAALSDTPVAMTGSASLAGAVLIAHGDGFSPPTPSQMSLLTASAVSGTFATINTPVGGASTVPPPILYALSEVIYNVSNPTLVDLVATNVNVPPSAEIGAPLSVSWTTSNNGSGPAQGPWTDRVLLSSDSAVGDDIELGAITFEGILDAEASAPRVATFAVPTAAFGSRFVIVVTDATSAVEESDERNNTLLAATPIDVTGAELVASNLAAPTTVVQGQPTNLAWTVTNAGNVPAASFVDSVRWSLDATPSGDDIVLAQTSPSGTLAAGASIARSASFSLPIAGSVPLGPGFLLISVDSSSAVIEPDAADNELGSAINVVEPPLPDLHASTILVTETLSAGAPIAVSWTTTNSGTATAAGSWIERATFVDAPGSVAAGAAIGQTVVSGPLPADASAPRGVSGTVPNVIGTRWVAVDVDLNDTVEEGSNDDNNRTVSSPVTIVAANLVPLTARGPSTAEVLGTVTVTYSAENNGPGESYGGCWSDRLSLSLDAVADGSDVILATTQRCDSPLANGATYAGPLNGVIPTNVVAGSYFLLLELDAQSARFESNESDNVFVVGTITVEPATTPNLTVTALAAPATGVTGQPLAIEWTIANIGQDPLTASWQDRVFLSTDAFFGGDTSFGPFAADVDVPAGGSVQRSAAITAPSQPGEYFVFVRTDDANQVPEWQGEEDNVSAAFGPITIGYGPSPDLRVTSIDAPAIVVSTEPFAFSYTVTNEGELPASGLWLETVSISNDAVIGGDILVGQFWRTGAVASGASVERTEQIVLPLSVIDATRLVVKVDATNTVDEIDPADEADNAVIDDATIEVTEPSLADLVVSAVSVPTDGIEGQGVTIAWTGTNQGELATPASWTDRVYLSLDNAFNSADTLVGSRIQVGAVAPGGTWNAALAVTLPPSLAGQSLFAIVVADALDAIEEGSGDLNNAGISPTTITIAPAPKPNLVPSIASLPATWLAGDTVQIGWKVDNAGDALAAGPWSDGVYLSTDGTLSGDDATLRVQQFSGDLAPTSNYTRAAAVTLPVDYVGGTRFLLVKADANNLVPESSSSDDVVASAPFTLTPTPAGDLVTSNLASLTSAFVFGAPANFTWTDSNTGTLAVTETWSDIVLLSKDATQSADDVPVALTGSGGAALAPGASLGRSTTANLPLSSDLADGTYWFLVRADANGAVTETSETNNVAVLGPVSIARPPLADLVVSVSSLPSDVAAGEPFSVGLTFTNIGPVNLVGNFLSTIAIEQGASDLLLQQFLTAGPIAAGQSVTVNRTVTIPALAAPTVAFTICVDSTSQIVETDEANNCALTSALPIRRPDLRVTSVSGPATATAGNAITVSYTVTNEGTGSATGFSTDSLRVSTDAAIGDDRLVGVRDSTQTLAAGQSVLRTANVTLPTDLEGAYRLVVEADGGNSLIELDEGDNAAIAAGVIDITPAARPNLVVESVSAPSTTLVGKPFTVSFTVRNVGDAPATAGWVDGVRVSTNNVLSADDAKVGTKLRVAALAPGASYAQSVTCIAPSSPGTFVVFASADSEQAILETTPSGESDNSASANGPLAVSSVVAMVQALAGEVQYGEPMPLVVSATVEGTGAPAAGIPVTLRTVVRGYPSDQVVTTGPDGTVAVNVAQKPNLAGVYSFGAAAPGKVPTPQAQMLVWGLQVTLDRTSVDLPELGGESGIITIRNLGDVAVTGLALDPASHAPGVGVNAFLPNGGVLAPDESRVATWFASASAEAAEGTIEFTITSDQVDPRVASMDVAIVPMEAALVAIPSTVSRTMPVGEVIYTTVTVRNLGTAPTGPLDVLIASAPWLQLVSPSSLPPLLPGAETAIEIRLAPDEDLPLGPYSAAPFLVVKDSTAPIVSVGVNGVFNASSDALATLEIQARNEFSFYGVPPSYPEAMVEIRRSGETALVAGGPVDNEGNATFERLEAGLYDIKVTAPGHGGFSQTRLLAPGDNEVFAFLPKQLVTYQWTVVPIPFTDEYTITVNLLFETNVPAPVITFDPLVLDFTAMEQPTAYREIKVTNHGLVTARDFRWEVEQSPRYEIIPLFEELGDILPGQTVIAPVLMVDKEFGSDSEGGVAANPLGCLAPGLGAVWLLLCGPADQEYRQSLGTLINNTCGGIGGPVFGGSGGGGGPSGSAGGPGGGPAGVNGAGTLVQTKNCQECYLECLDALDENFGLGAAGDELKDLTGLGTASSVVECLQAIGTASSIADVGPCLPDALPVPSPLCTAGKVGSACTCAPGGGSPCGGAFGSPLGDGIAGADAWSLHLPETEDEVVQAYNTAVLRLLRIYRPRLYELGSPDFLLSAEPEDSEVVGALLGAIVQALQPGSADGALIDEGEAQAILALPQPTLWGGDLATPFIERWNRSREYYALGWFNAVDVPQGFSTDFIETDRLDEFVADGTAALAELASLGYGNPFQEMANMLDLLRDHVQPGQGKCVKIAVELEQTVTLVRQAFAATLSLTNETETAMEGIDIDVIVKDADGNDATDKFALLGPDLAGLQDVNGNGTLGTNATGSASWTIVPGDSAAPEGPTFYFVSGALKYALGGQVLSIPLFPVQITVLPNASLSMQYFIETQVYGDDPFTPESEPSVPFSLGLWAKNNGGGTAGQVKVVSAQPQIVENNDGLLIDFQLIGSQVNETPVSPSLTVEMGDILPGEVSVAQWLMISSLQGEFTGYSATIESTNGFSDPEFAIVDEADVNAMTHVVRADVPLDDGRPDFLGNLVPNVESLPDRIYLSNSAIEPVTAVIDAFVEPIGGLQVQVTVPAGEGWRYVRIEDPFLGARPLIAARRSDGKTIQLGHNAWQTSFIDRSTPEPEAKRHVHLFDRGGDGVYILTFSADAIAPSVSTWAVVKSHASLEAPAFNVVPGSMPWSDSRLGGIDLLTLSFSEPIDPATAIPANIAVTAYAEDGSEVDLDLDGREFDLRLGNQYADLRFTPPLPKYLRYCIRLVNVKDLAGNALAGDSARIDLASIPGDLTNDLRVTVNDGGALASLLGTSPIDPLNPYHVRADIDRDGSITMSDMGALLAHVGTDLRFVPTTCIDLGSEAPDEPIKKGTLEPTVSDEVAVVADGADVQGNAQASSGASGRGAAGSGDEALAPTRLLGRLGDELLRGAARTDLLAVRATPVREREASEEVAREDDVGDEASARVDAEVIAAIYGLVTLEPGDRAALDAGWRVVRLPEPLRVPAATATLAELLRSAGLEVATVIERGDGQCAALTDEVRLARRANIPASWCERLVPTLLAKAGVVGALVPDGDRSSIVVLDGPPSSAMPTLIRLLVARREFERVELVVVPLGVPHASGSVDSEDADEASAAALEEVSE